MPELTSLAERGHSFPARSEATWTLPSVTSILTGQSPDVHGVQSHEDRLQPGIGTLPQYFRHEGWNTIGIVANPWFSRRKGLDIGFDKFYNITEDCGLLSQVSLSSVLNYILHFRSRSAGFTIDFSKHPTEPLIVDLASEWLAAADRPVFMMVHTQGAHSPYHHPPSWNSHQDDSNPRRAEYLNLIEFVDAQLGRFLERLGEDAIVVVTSDHGEALGESGHWGHQDSEIDMLHEVPLVVSGASPPFSDSTTHLEVHDWLRTDIAPSNIHNERPTELQERLEALGYVGGGHSA